MNPPLMTTFMESASGHRDYDWLDPIGLASCTVVIFGQPIATGREMSAVTQLPAIAFGSWQRTGLDG
jgi:hypothetical protein